MLNYIHPNAKLGKNVVVEPFSVIYDDVEIGDNTWVGPHVTIFPGARIGKNCKLYPGASIAAIPQDLKFEGEYTTVIMGNDNTVRESVTIHRGTSASGSTIIGNDNMFMAYSHVAHDCRVGNHCVFANSATLAGHVEVGDWAILGGLSAVHQFAKIGTHAILQGGVLIDKDVPPYVKAARFPAAYAGINSIGLRRRNFPQEVINTIQNIYRILFQSDMKRADAIAEIENFPQSAERDIILEFIKNSERGLMRGYKEEKEE